MLKGIETAVYYVDDLDAAKKWYAETFDIEPNHDTPYYVGFSVAGYELGLHPTGGEPRASGTGGQTAYWTVDNIEDVVEHLVECGATQNHNIQDVGAGIRIASVVDPFGNVFGVIQNPNSPNRSA